MGKASDIKSNDIRDLYTVLDERFNEQQNDVAKWDHERHTDIQRGKIANFFVRGYVYLIFSILILVPIFNVLVIKFSGDSSLLLDIKTILTTVGTVIGTSLGFVVGYYFKENK